MKRIVVGITFVAANLGIAILAFLYGKGLGHSEAVHVAQTERWNTLQRATEFWIERNGTAGVVIEEQTQSKFEPFILRGTIEQENLEALEVFLTNIADESTQKLITVHLKGD